MKKLSSHFYVILILLLVGVPQLIIAKESKRILFLGDSLSAGYGVKKEASAPQLLEDMLNSEKPQSVKIINASISGSTSASATSRLKWQLKEVPDILVLALGSNDGLRGVFIRETQKNLQAAIKLAQSNKIEILLVGMKLPINYGAKYRLQFEQMYQNLATLNKLPLVPFLLEGIGGVKGLNLEDGIHPNEEGQKIMAKTLLKHIRPML